jgi:hypothetical protein
LLFWHEETYWLTWITPGHLSALISELVERSEARVS